MVAERRFLVGGTRWRITRLPDGVCGKAQGPWLSFGGICEMLGRAIRYQWRNCGRRIARRTQASHRGQDHIWANADRLGYPFREGGIEW